MQMQKLNMILPTYVIKIKLDQMIIIQIKSKNTRNQNKTNHLENLDRGQLSCYQWLYL